MVAPNSLGNPLSAGSLAVFMAASLPKDVTPQLTSPYDATALAVHAGMIAVGFRLVGLGEDHKIEAHSEANDAQPLPTEWNASGSYAFRYAHAQSSMEYLVKVNRLGNKAVIFGLAMGDDKTASFDIPVNDFLSPSSLPATPLPSEGSMEGAKRALQDIFISVGRLSDLGSLLQVRIIQKLAPGIHKEGYEEVSEQSSSTNNNNREERRRSPPRRESERTHHDPLRDPIDPRPARPSPFDNPLSAPPRRPNLPEPMPGFEDEYEINRPPRGGIPGRGPANIGENDLYPPGLGPSDPLGPGFMGGGLPRPGGGMHPTFDDPLFGGHRGGGGGYDPMAPPGSRYDPVGPGGAPRDNRGGGRFPGGGGGFGGGFGGPPNPFGGFGGGDFI